MTIRGIEWMVAGRRCCCCCSACSLSGCWIRTRIQRTFLCARCLKQLAILCRCYTVVTVAAALLLLLTFDDAAVAVITQCFVLYIEGTEHWCGWEDINTNIMDCCVLFVSLFSLSLFSTFVTFSPESRTPTERIACTRVDSSLMCTAVCCECERDICNVCVHWESGICSRVHRNRTKSGNTTFAQSIWSSGRSCR